MNWCQLTNLRKYLKESYFAGTRFANKIIWRHISKTDFCLVIFADSMSKHFAEGSQNWFEVAFQFRIPKIQITISKYMLGIIWHLAFRQETFFHEPFWFVYFLRNFVAVILWYHGNFAMGIFPHCWNFGTGTFRHLFPLVETFTVGPSYNLKSNAASKTFWPYCEFCT